MLSRSTLLARQSLRAASTPALRAGVASTAPVNSTSNSELSKFGQKHVAAGLSGRLSQAVITSGKGSYITLNDDRGEYLDFTSGIGVTALGEVIKWLLIRRN